MASYWQSIGAMLSGSAGTAEPRRRSIYEQEDGYLVGFDGVSQGDVGFETDPTEGSDGYSPGTADRRIANQGPLRGTEPSTDAQHNVAVSSEQETQADRENASPEVAAKPIQIVTETDNPLPVTPHTQAIGHGSKRDNEAPTFERQTKPEAVATSRSQSDPNERHTSELAAASANEAEQDIAVPAPNLPVEDENKQSPSDDAPSPLATTVAQLRTELDAVVRAEPLATEQPNVGDQPVYSREPEPSPLIVEIDHIEISITRPNVPGAAPRPQAHSSAEPIISLDDYLDQSEARSV